MYTSQQCNLKAHKAKLIAQQKETEIGTGNTCKPTADSCQCMAKPLQYCKVISPQLIKISEKKRNWEIHHQSRTFQLTASEPDSADKNNLGCRTILQRCKSMIFIFIYIYIYIYISMSTKENILFQEMRNVYK